MLRVGYYLNQFFAGVGGEEHANHPPERRDGAVGPGRALQGLLGDEGRVVSTLVCGDNFFNERGDEAHAAVRAWLEACRPDVVVAGPAFAAGRYGSACAQVCRLATAAGVPAVTGMHPENPGLLLYPKAYVVPTGNSAAEMGRTLTAMLPLVRKLGGRVALGPAAVEGYLPRGVRRPGMRDASGAERAVAMLVAKLAGRPFQTEIPVDAYDAVPPAPPIRDLRGATIALVTSGAIVPRGNPDRFKRCSDTKWARYSLAGLDALSSDAFECVHGGFYNQMASDNPNLVLPLDAVRELEREGVFGRLVDFYCSTTGNDQRLLDCRRNGAEIAAALVTERADGVLLVCT
jgi:glycine/betaine/sarcosine/D-proline reductase family selenoprotein B